MALTGASSWRSRCSTSSPRHSRTSTIRLRWACWPERVPRLLPRRARPRAPPPRRSRAGSRPPPGRRPRRPRALGPQLHRRARHRARLRPRHDHGVLVFIAVISHDFADGLNTVSFVLSQSEDRRQARWLRSTRSRPWWARSWERDQRLGADPGRDPRRLRRLLPLHGRHRPAPRGPFRACVLATRRADGGRVRRGLRRHRDRRRLDPFRGSDRAQPPRSGGARGDPGRRSPRSSRARSRPAPRRAPTGPSGRRVRSEARLRVWRRGWRCPGPWPLQFTATTDSPVRAGRGRAR